MNDLTILDIGPAVKICPSCGSVIKPTGIKHKDKNLYCSAQCYESRGGTIRKHPLYNAWDAMKQRCLNPKHPHFERYGGRGIGICDEWMDVRGFLAWTETQVIEPRSTLDRKNNNLGYSPDNCRFVSRRIQSNNRNNTVLITAFEETKSLTLWAEDPRCVVGTPTLTARLRWGWTPEAAIATPVTKGISRRRGLSDEQVLEIYRRVAGGEARYAVGRALGICSTTICEIIRGETYRHLGLTPIPSQKSRAVRTTAL